MTGIYLTKGTSDIFDSMEKLGLKKVNRLINDLRAINSNAPNYTEKITLGKEKVNIKTLEEVLGYTKYNKKEFEDFVRIFKNISNKNTEGSKKQIDKELIPIKFTDDFAMMLDKIDDQICWSLFDIEENSDVKNKFGIESLDVSDTDFNFDVYYPNGRRGTIKISEFIRVQFGNKFEKGVVYEFARDYNKIKNRALNKSDDEIAIPEFKFNPKDIKSTFISLTTETYPHGYEEGVYKYLPEGLQTDKYGNLYHIIGNSDTMFTSHLDTASRDKSDIILVSKSKNGQDFIMSDGTTILGADDKAGVSVMMYMMAHNVPGVYYFFLGEERGGIGSGKVADDFNSFEFLKNIKKVISFDRRNYFSVITEQMGMRCCSNEFGESLCKELNKSGLKLNLDPTGVFTDSYNFVDYVPECTNISVGYFNEHTHEEIQNITYLERLAKACVAADWNKLTVKRKIGFDSEILEKWSELIRDFKEGMFFNECSVKGEEGKLIISIEFDDVSLKNAYDDLSQVETILLMHRCNPDIKFDGNILKIQIG